MKTNLSFLIVDDDLDTLRTLRSLLEYLGANTIHACESAEHALEQLEDGRFDVILTDYQMKGMDGVAFTKRLREAGNPIPVILLSGAPDQAAVLQALQQPSVDFFGKPFEIDALEGAVDRLLAA